MTVSTTQPHRELAMLKMSRGCIAGLALVVGVAIALRAAHEARPGAVSPRFKAVAFDYFVLFNPASVVGEVDRVYPGRGREFTNLWRTRQFEYSWLRSITSHYVDFFAVTDDALIYTANALKVGVTAPQRQQLLDAYLPAPHTLAGHGQHVATLA